MQISKEHVTEYSFSFLLSYRLIDGCEWSALRTGRFTPGEGAPATRWIGGWVGLGTGLDAAWNRALTKSPYPVAIPSELPLLPNKLITHSFITAGRN
jgi:hypothetical protein